MAKVPDLVLNVEVGEALVALEVINALTSRKVRHPDMTDAQRLRAVRMVARKALRQATVKAREGRH